LKVLLGEDAVLPFVELTQHSEDGSEARVDGGEAGREGLALSAILRFQSPSQTQLLLSKVPPGDGKKIMVEIDAEAVEENDNDMFVPPRTTKCEAAVSLISGEDEVLYWRKRQAIVKQREEKKKQKKLQKHRNKQQRKQENQPGVNAKQNKKQKTSTKQSIVGSLNVSEEDKAARAKRFETDGPPPSPPKRNFAWAGGSIVSNKEQALQQYLARETRAAAANTESEIKTKVHKPAELDAAMKVIANKRQAVVKAD
jgi:hypothetical protein